MKSLLLIILLTLICGCTGKIISEYSKPIEEIEQTIIANKTVADSLLTNLDSAISDLKKRKKIHLKIRRLHVLIKKYNKALNDIKTDTASLKSQKVSSLDIPAHKFDKLRNYVNQEATASLQEKIDGTKNHNESKGYISYMKGYLKQQKQIQSLIEEHNKSIPEIKEAIKRMAEINEKNDSLLKVLIQNQKKVDYQIAELYKLRILDLYNESNQLRTEILLEIHDLYKKYHRHIF